MAEAREIALKYMTPRYCRLETYEKYVEGTQYDGRFPFLAQGEDAPPVHERAPCVVYGIHQNAIRKLIDFMMGEGRYPNVSGASSEDDEELDDEWGLDEEASALLERWVNGPLTKAARLKAMFPDGLAMAMTGGGVAMVGAIRNGQPMLSALPAKWCSPTFSTVTNEVIALEVFYPYLVEVKDENTGKWKEKCFLYRRLIDQTRDVVFLPGEGREDGKMPAWKEDPAQTTTHDLGFCPVRWYAFDRLTPTAAHFDGKPIHATLLDETDGLNLSLSQRHRASLYAGDPQIWETGVDSNENPAPMGRFGRVVVEAQQIGPGGQKVGVFTAAPRAAGYGRGSARKKGPGIVWRYTSELAKVGILELSPGTIEGMTQHAEDLRKKIAEDLSVVLIDPTDAKTFGDLSGKALAFLFSAQVARADRIRLDAGDNLILACIDMLLRICLTMHQRKNGSVRVPGMTKVAEILAKLEQDEEIDGASAAPNGEPEAPRPTRKAWFGPRLELEWGRYFPPSAEEENFIVTYCVQAKTAGLMPDEIILEKLRDVFSFGSTEELMKKLEEQQEKAKKQAMEEAEHAAATNAKYSQGMPDGPPFPPKGPAKT